MFRTPPVAQVGRSCDIEFEEKWRRVGGPAKQARGMGASHRADVISVHCNCYAIVHIGIKSVHDAEARFF